MSRMQEQENQPTDSVFMGIDVSKDTLDVYVLPGKQRFAYANNETGIAKLIRDCAKLPPELIALEATGKYHEQAHRLLHNAGFKVAVVNPYRSRKFADALGQLAKTDSIDAAVLASYAATLRPQATLPPSEHKQALRDLNVARRQVLDEIGNLSRQLKTTNHPLAARQIRSRIKTCERHQSVLEQEIRALIREHEDLRHRFEILTSIPGIGIVTATTLLTDLDELGQVNAKEIAALAGVAPMNRDSGNLRGKRTIRGGRRHVRRMLYMCAVAMSRRDGMMGQHYRRLVREGKKPKVALIAVARKLAILANTLIAEDRHWQPVQQ
jgi:transposase